eukprot:1533706-Lingulodinium_polyedra.AAC.1
MQRAHAQARALRREGGGQWQRVLAEGQAGTISHRAGGHAFPKTKRLRGALADGSAQPSTALCP